MAPNSPPKAKADPMIGVRVSDYNVVAALGGTVGHAYKARHTSTGAFVVLKFLPDSLSGDVMAVERFRSQAEALSAIEHPGVVKVVGQGSADHRHYVALEFVEGQVLQQMIDAEGALPPDRALAIVESIAKGLRGLHEAGLVHGNVQPANVVVSADDSVTLIGLGLARQPKPPDAEIETDSLGVRVGPHPAEDRYAPAYYPPEVARGRPLDVRSDLYQLGATLYHMLAGQPPFEADSTEQLALRYIREDIPSIDQSLRTAPVLLCRLLDRLLMRDPDARYQTAVEAVEAIDRVGSMLARKAEAERKAADERRAAADRRAAERARELRSRRRKAEPEPEEERPRSRRKPHRPWLKPAILAGVVLLLLGGIGALLMTPGVDEKEKLPEMPEELAAKLAAEQAALEGKPIPAKTVAKKPAKTPEKTPRKSLKPPKPILGHARTAVTDPPGGKAKYERGQGRDNIGFWLDDSIVFWLVDVPRSGLYEVDIVYAGEREIKGNIIGISLDSEEIQVTLEDTGNWGNFVERKAVGRLKASEGKRQRLTVRPVKRAKALMNLQSVTLRWVTEADGEGK